MHIILGGTGHIGSALAEALIEKGELVTIISRDPKKKQEWEQKGADVAIADVLDVKHLQKIFNTGERLFLLNPPAAPSTDTVAQEKETLNAILTALEGSRIKKVVAESTYGAQPGNGLGDLGVLYEMEQALANMNIPTTIIRGAYYMSNWAASLETAREAGTVYTFYPVDFKLPMVSPGDIGGVAARLMLEPVTQTGLHNVEGPQQYSARDVADAFSAALGKDVKAVEIPESHWIQALEDAGFSAPAAKSMAAMTHATLKGKYTPPGPVRGTTTLTAYIGELVASAK
ncbi:NmrA family NAD(P)-binding protein [Chitinophaga ginsengisegetis]|uniref:NmrA family NAD(P)-binding protein n=1 Tax=Chitinophaga ginsengisegetis TaxID=393003 RepID=UPI00343538ED